MLIDRLACPRSHSALRAEGDLLVSAENRKYPVVNGLPILLLDDHEQTIGIAQRSLAYGTGELRDPRGLYLESLGISDDERVGIERIREESRVDPVVSYLVGATNGIAYKDVIGTLRSYPVPDLRLPQAGPGRPKLLDIGCSWGRWCLAAERKGYSATGIDPSLGAVAAAKRVATEQKVPAEFVVGDSRFLPFPDASFEVVFSYSVLQHLSRENVRLTANEISRVLKPGGLSLVQMPNYLGIRCLYHQARRGFRPPSGVFDVRYWSLRDLKSLFEERIGPSTFTVDCFFGLGLQKTDMALMSKRHRWIVRLSASLTALSVRWPWLVNVADSIYITSIKKGA